jgi:hypothetical protein
VRGVESGGVEPLGQSLKDTAGADHNEPHIKAAPRGFSFWCLDSDKVIRGTSAIVQRLPDEVNKVKGKITSVCVVVRGR